VIDSAILFQHVSLESARQILCGVVEQFSFGLCASLRSGFHAPNLLEFVASFNLQIQAMIQSARIRGVLAPVATAERRSKNEELRRGRLLNRCVIFRHESADSWRVGAGRYSI